MPSQWIWPMLAMVGLTLVVWLRMYVERLSQMRQSRIHPQSVASSAQMYSRLADTRAADNFRNLFELPVLFYAALLFAHSGIHCSYNKVMHRFAVYVLGGLTLWAMWGVLLVHVL